MQLADIRFLFAFDRWATTKVLDAAAGVDEATWSATNVVDERGLGGILVHHLGASQRWRHGLTGATGEAPRPEHEPLPDLAALRAAWEREWAGYDAWFDRMDPAWLDQEEEGVSALAGARPRRQPRDAAPLRGGGPADRRRPLPGRPRHDRLRRHGRRHGRHDMSRLMDLVAGEAPDILLVIGTRRPGRARRPPPLPGPPRARRRARPDLARPVRRGRPDRHRRRRAGRLHRCPARARGARRRRRPDDRAGRPELDHARSRGSPTRDLDGDRRPLDRPGRGRARARCRARRSPGSATSPGGSWPSAARPTAPRTSCSPGRCGDRRAAATTRASFAANEALWDAWTAVHAERRRSTTSRGSRPAASGSGRTRSS